MSQAAPPESASDLLPRALRGAVWMVANSWAGRLLGLGALFVLARLLRPEDFGLVAMATVFTALVGVLQDQGLEDALVQRRELEPDALDTAFWTALAVGGLLAAFTWLVSPVVASGYGEPRLTGVLRALGLSFLLASPAVVPRSQLRRELRFQSLAGVSLLAALAGGAAAIGLAWRDFGAFAIVGGRLVESAVASIGLCAACAWRPRVRVTAVRLRELLTFGLPLTAFKLLNFFNRHGDDLLIGWVLGPVALGYYEVAYRLFRTFTNMLVGVANVVGLPFFSRLALEPARVRAAFIGLTEAIAVVAFPAFLGLALVAPEFIHVAFGADWQPSVPVLQVLAFIGILHAIQIPSSPVLIGLGRPGWRLALAVVNTGANLIGFLIAVRFGIVAVAAAYVIRGYLVTPLLHLLLGRLIGLRTSPYLARLASPALATLVMLAGVALLRAGLPAALGPAPRLGLAVLLGGALYALALRALDPELVRRGLRLLRRAGPAAPVLPAAPGTVEP